MSLLGEEVVEEWLNRNGYFTIRGVKDGNSQLDILAIKPLPEGKHDCRHIECQLSVNSIGYVSTGNAKRMDDAELREEVQKWINKKFVRQEALLQRLCPGAWTKELVYGNVKHNEEIDLIAEAGIVVRPFSKILAEMDKSERDKEGTIIKSATGADLFDLMRIQF